MIRISMPVGADSPRQESGHHASSRANFPLGSTLPFPPYAGTSPRAQEWYLDLTLGVLALLVPPSSQLLMHTQLGNGEGSS